MSLKKLLPKKILSLDLGSYGIKVLVGKERGKGIIIDDYFTIPTPEGAYIDGRIMDKDLLHYVIDEGLKENRVKTKDTYLTINSSEIIVREVIIPKVDAEEIENVLSYQVRDYIPVKPENYIVQFKPIASVYEDDIEKLSILLIGIPKEMVESHLELLKDLDLNPLVLDYQPNSLVKLLSLCNSINEDYPTENLTFAAIDIGHESTKVSIVKNGTIYVSRVIEIGGKYVEQSVLNYYDYEDFELTKIRDELRNISIVNEEDSEYGAILNLIKGVFASLNERIEIVFRYYLSREPDNRINMILLYGGNANYSGLDSLYSNYFNVPTVIVESLDNVYFDGNIYEYINSIGALVRR